MGQDVGDFFVGDTDFQYPYDPYNYVPNPGALAVGGDPSIPYGQSGGDYTNDPGYQYDPGADSTTDGGGPDWGALLNLGATALDTGVQLFDPGGGEFPGPPGSDPSGGGMADELDFSGMGLPAVSRGVPWGTMTRQVRSAARIFGPYMLLPIVRVVAAYWTSRLQRLGLQITISPSALVMKVLSKRARRGRGITARQLAITSRTIGKVQRMHERIRHFCGRGGGGGHRRRYAFQRRRRK